MKRHIVTPVDVGTYLVAAIQERGLTLQYVSQTTQLSLQHLEQLVSCEQILTGDAALLLADMLDVPVLELLAVQSDYCLDYGEPDDDVWAAKA